MTFDRPILIKGNGISLLSDTEFIPEELSCDVTFKKKKCCKKYKRKGKNCSSCPRL
ncbi:hypothetical protein R9C00_06490 [Flammeovirgaceae bacterium SG7u.111]|nr:hypothetical protein R9C00_06490 [Flammeovirgaceae bacterium SG7u.111]